MEVMEALWEIGQASVREIKERLPKRDRPAYTTVQTIVRRLEEKRAVRQVKTIGNAFIFEAAITRKAAHRRLIDDLLEIFGGSARPLMAHLAEAGKLTLEDVRQIDEMLLAQTAEAERVVRHAPKER
jgi:predicted transcriptional regulator